MSKPPAKRSAKRKKAEAEDDFVRIGTSTDNAALTSLDLSSNVSPKSIADALLTLLPKEATKQHPSAKKLTKAFTIVATTLEQRAIELARRSESEGQRLQLEFNFPAEGKSGDDEEPLFTSINVPEETFAATLKFLDGREIMKASLVSKAWLTTCRLPSLWRKLDKHSGFTNKSRKLNLTYLLKLLSRGQFSCLTHFVMPYHSVQLSTNGISKMAMLLPHLTKFEMAPEVWSTGPKLKDEHLLAIVDKFPELTSLTIELWGITNDGIANMAREMGDRLHDLKINGTINYLNDSALSAISEFCPNIKFFAYEKSFSSRVIDPYLSGKAVIDFIRKSTSLEAFQLTNAGNFQVEQAKEIFALERDANRKVKIDIKGERFIARPGSILTF